MKQTIRILFVRRIALQNAGLVNAILKTINITMNPKKLAMKAIKTNVTIATINHANKWMRILIAGLSVVKK